MTPARNSLTRTIRLGKIGASDAQQRAVAVALAEGEKFRPIAP